MYLVTLVNKRTWIVYNTIIVGKNKEEKENQNLREGLNQLLRLYPEIEDTIDVDSLYIDTIEGKENDLAVLCLQRYEHEERFNGWLRKVCYAFGSRYLIRGKWVQCTSTSQ